MGSNWSLMCAVSFKVMEMFRYGFLMISQLQQCNKERLIGKRTVKYVDLVVWKTYLKWVAIKPDRRDRDSEYEKDTVVAGRI